MASDMALRQAMIAQAALGCCPSPYPARSDAYQTRMSAASRAAPQVNGCGCPKSIAVSPGRFDLVRSFPLKNCPNPMGGRANARAVAGFTESAGQTPGGYDQSFDTVVPVSAAALTVAVDSGQIPLDDSGGVISQVQGMSIRQLAVGLSASGDGAAAFDADVVYRTGTLVIRQGGAELNRLILQKLKPTDFGLYGTSVWLNPLPADFSGLTFQLLANTATDGVDDYDLIVTLQPQWA